MGRLLLYRDYERREIRLPQERLDHIMGQHSYMMGREWSIGETLENPDEVRVSNQDQRVFLHYRWYNTPEIDSRFICVVVKILDNDTFVVTAYPTQRAKRGDLAWRRS